MLAPPIAQFQPTPTGPTTPDLGDPVVAAGYQAGIGEVMYQTPPQPHSQMSHPHTPSPQLQPSLPQGYPPAESNRGKQTVPFDPTSHYGDQSKRSLPEFRGEEGVAPFSPTPDTSLDDIQPFQLHSNYRPPPSGEGGNGGVGSEAPYSPPELIPEHQGDNQSDCLNQSHDICPPEDHSGPLPMGGEEPNSHRNPMLAYESPLLGGGGGEPKPTKVNRNMSEHSTTVRPHPLTPPTPGSQGLKIDMKESVELDREMKSSSKPDAVPPSHLPLRRSVSPGDELDIRPSAPRPPPLIRRGREGHSSDEEDDVFLPALAPHPAPSPPPPHTHSSPQAPPHTVASRESADEDEEETEKMETVATTPSETTPIISLLLSFKCVCVA